MCVRKHYCFFEAGATFVATFSESYYQGCARRECNTNSPKSLESLGSTRDIEPSCRKTGARAGCNNK